MSRRSVFFRLILVFLTLSTLPAHGAAAVRVARLELHGDSVDVAEAEVLVKFRRPIEESAREALVARLGDRLESGPYSALSRIGYTRVRLRSGSDIAEQLRTLRANPQVEQAEPNYVYRVQQSAGGPDPLLSEQWAIPAMQLPQAWRRGRGQGVTVALIDTGVRGTHPDLNGRVTVGYDFVAQDGDPDDENGHGTMAAGVIAANQANGEGISGVAPEAALMPLRAFDAAGTGTAADIAAAILWAADRNVQVINLSFGGSERSDVLEEAIDLALQKDIIVVAAAGNGGGETALYPAAHHGVVAIGASTRNGQVWSMSNRGDAIDFVAPGVDMVSTSRAGYGTASGTSIAAAAFSGAVAVLLSALPDISAYEAVGRIGSTALDLPPAGADKSAGRGLPQVSDAIALQVPPFADAALAGLKLVSNRVRRADALACEITLANRGRTKSLNVSLTIEVNGVKVWERSGIDVLRETVISAELPPPGGAGNYEIKASVRAEADGNSANDQALLLLSCRPDDDTRYVVLYKNRPFVHTWVALQAMNILPEGALKAELSTYFWGGHEEVAKALFEYEVDPQKREPYSPPPVPSVWTLDRKDGRSVAEGTFEEDEDDYGLTVLNANDAPGEHFWNPDAGYGAGLKATAANVSLPTQRSAIQRAQVWWAEAIAAYRAGQNTRAYYLLGRVTHLLGDMGVPDHAHADEHPGDNLEGDVTSVLTDYDDFSNYEEYSAVVFRDIKLLPWDLPKAVSQLPLELPPGYVPAGDDVSLAKLFYNQAEYTQYFDSSNEPGENVGFGGQALPFAITAENGSKHEKYQAIAYLNGTDDKYRVDFDWVGAMSSPAVSRCHFYSYCTELYESTPDSDRDYDLSRAYGQVAVSDALWREINNTLVTLGIDYQYRGVSRRTSISDFKDSWLGGYWMVPDRHVKAQIERLMPENMRYIAALYQLFWDTVRPALAIQFAGTGTGSVSVLSPTVSCTASCEQSFLKGSTVTLTAVPNSASTFTGFSGACSGTAPCVVTMSQPQTLVANFTAVPCSSWNPVPSSLSAEFWAGGGAVKVTGTPAGCAGNWSASSGTSWLSVSPSSGVQNDVVTVSWAKNDSLSGRSGSVTIGGRSVGVTQYAKSASLYTTVSGTLASDTTWSRADSPYYLSGNVVIPVGKTLTIQQGVIVKCASGTLLSVYGTLRVSGAADAPVYFTDYRDDTVGGDTNGDGAASAPAVGSWRGIYVETNGSASIDRAMIRYAGYYSSCYSCVPYGAVYKVGAGTLAVTNSVVTRATAYGVRAVNTTDAITISGNTLSENGWAAVEVSNGGPNVTVSGNTITATTGPGINCVSTPATIAGNKVSGSSQYGLAITGAAAVTVTGNTLTGNTVGAVQLGSGAAGTFIAGDNVLGGPIHVESQTVGGTASWNSPFVYYVKGTIYVGTGATLTVTAGRIVKFTSGGLLSANPGTLRVTGTSTAPVYLTDYRDDTIGGDSNGDGAASAPAVGSWRGIYVETNASASIDRAVIRYAGYYSSCYSCVPYGAVYKKSAGTLILTNSVVTRAQTYGVRALDTTETITISGNTLTDNGSAAVDVSNAGPNVTISGNTITATNGTGINCASTPAMITGNDVSGSTQYGVQVSGASSAVLARNRIHGNPRGVYVTASANPVIGGSFSNINEIYDNASSGVENTTTTLVINARNNWWGDPSGPTHASNPFGRGDRVSDHVDYGTFVGTAAADVAANATVLPAVGDLGGALVGGSRMATVTVANNGRGSLAIGTAALSGVPDFSINSDLCSGRTLDPGLTCALGVTFAAAARGHRSSTLTIPTNAANAPVLRVLLNGSGLPVDLPVTGQTSSYGARDDGLVRAGFPSSASRFQSSGDSILTDLMTGLSWTLAANSPGPSWCTPAVTKNWAGALGFVACLNSSGYLGYTDWRLPNINELESLINAGAAAQTSWWSSNGFTSAQASTYWSSTAWTTSGQAWAVDTTATSANGAVRPQSTGTLSWVWPVRGNSAAPIQIARTGVLTSTAAGDDGLIRAGAAWPATRFEAVADGSIHDVLTDLFWAADAGTPTVGACTGGAKAWPAALDYVACLNAQTHLGHNDWRLANRKEMRSLVDHSASAPALISGHPFVNVQTTPYWTSSTVAADTTRAWQHGFGTSAAGLQGALKTAVAPVWPVRGGVLPTRSVVTGTSASGIESNSTVAVQFTLTPASTEIVTIIWATSEGTASAGSDYVAATGTLTFNPGETAKSVSIQLKDDALNEATEWVRVSVTGATNAFAGGGATLSIVDDDAALPALSVGDVSIVEGDSGAKNAVFAVALSPASGRTVTVQFACAAGTATVGTDFTAASGVLTFEPGATSKTVSIPIRGDVMDEQDETFVVTLSAPAHATIVDASGTGTITDDDATPALSVDDVVVIEGNGSSSTATFTVRLTGMSASSVTVNCSTTDGTAMAGSDYSTLGTTKLTFAPGETAKTVAVATLGDTVDEPDENFIFNLSGAANATVADGQGLATITDDDKAVLSIGDVVVSEGNVGSGGSARFAVTLSSPASQTVTVQWSTGDGSAAANTDYVSGSGTVTFNPGEIAKTCDVAIVGDQLDEFDETFTVVLSSAAGADVLDGEGAATIRDDDTASLTISDVTVAEGNSGPTAAQFVVSLGVPTYQVVTVAYSTADGTGVAGNAYVTASGSLRFEPGETAKSITVYIRGDVVDELDQVFYVNLTNPTNTTIADGQGIGTISDDDTSMISISDVNVTEGGATSGLAPFAVTLSTPNAETVTVQYATVAGSAVAGNDFVQLSGTLTFEPGATRKIVAVSILGDSLREAAESFTLVLSGALKATIADGTGICTIADDDTSGPLAVPSGLAATATTTSTVTVTWYPVAGATQYEIYRRLSGTGFGLIASTVGTGFVDSSVSAGAAYLYAVRARDGSGGATAMSAPELATVVSFSADPLVPGSMIRWAHIAELRLAVNVVRALAGQQPMTLTDSQAGVRSSIKAAHITELRAALDAARGALGLTIGGYTDPTIAPGTTPMKAVHLQELRDRIK